jgi:ATP/maltotriose-dependent transcriptional regulator MalT
MLAFDMEPMTRHGPFVGREREIATLTERLEAAGRGEGGVVFVSGEPGIGKSRLLAEFSARAQAAGWLVLSGRAYDTEGMPPYLAFAEAIAQYLRIAADDEAGPRLAEAAREVALLVPELRERLPDAGARPSLGPEADRYRLFEAVSDFFLRLSATSEATGLLLCLDDLHWADRSTLLLFQHLTRKLRGARVLVVGTFRTEEVDRSRPLFDLLAELAREQQDQRLPLARLSPDETGSLVASLSGATPAAALVQAIHHQTDGNPFFVQEVVRHLQSQEHGLAGAGPRPEDWGLSEGVREVIGRRLSRLGVETQRLLASAAVLGDGFDTPLLRAVTNSEAVTVMQALEEAERAGMLREQGSSYVFGHPLIRQVIYEGLSLPRRQELHLRAAEAIETIPAARLDPHLAALATHYRLAGAAADPEKAIDSSFRAGDAAQALFAYEEAASFWGAALEFMERAGRPSEERARLLERLGELMYTRGFHDYARSIEYYERSLALYETDADEEHAAEVHSQLGAVFVSNAAATMNLERARAHFRVAESILGRGPARIPQVQLYQGLACLAIWEVHTEEGLIRSRRAMDIAQEIDKASLAVRAAVFHGCHLIASGRLASGLEVMDQACETADQLDQTFAGFLTAFWRGGRSFLLADPRDAQKYYERELAKPRQAQAPVRRRALLSPLAAALALAGDLSEAEVLLGELGDEVYDQGAGAGGRPQVAFWAGDWERAGAFWHRALDRHEAVGNRQSRSEFGFCLAKLFRVRGDAGAAEAMLQSVLAAGIDGPDILFTLTASTELALLHAENGRPDDAAPHLLRCHEIVAQGEDWRGLAGRVALAEASVAAAEGHTAEAEPLFEQAIDVFCRYALPWDEAEALHLWGRALFRTRRRAAAPEKFDAAIEIYQRHGAGRAWIDRVETDRQRLHGTIPARPSYPGGLTEREVEVLRLITQGKSNREIGAELVLSLRTVERHIVNIYSKLGIHSKAQATAYAFTHELAQPL